MGSASRDRMADIHAVIGHAIKRLLKSGTEVCPEEILAFLKEQEAQSIDGCKKLYGRAIAVVEESAKKQDQSTA
ncbi:hypothetical protein [Pantoea agglomerans]|uniref:hypothetical protein n=1 Tax=Enterobacter agglomerans TaxID=549 RepID=UPI000E215924|nr:hypothetical protein [Pantoea agglomerans]